MRSKGSSKWKDSPSSEEFKERSQGFDGAGRTTSIRSEYSRSVQFLVGVEDTFGGYKRLLRDVSKSIV
jgi:hypothetical protein